MSYSVHAYLTDAKKVSSVFGSNDQRLFNELLGSMKNDLANLDNYFSEYVNSQKNALEVLKDIVTGKIRFLDIPFMYGYVYEKICEHFGEEIYNSENIWELENQSSFIPIPLSTDFPHIISIEKKRLKEKKDKFSSLKEGEGEGIGEYDYEEEMSDLAFIFDEAIEKSKDLVIFVY